MLGGILRSVLGIHPSAKLQFLNSENGFTEETIISRIRCGSLGYERCQFRWPYYGQQAAHVPCRLCLRLWSVPLRLLQLPLLFNPIVVISLTFCLCSSQIWNLFYFLSLNFPPSSHHSLLSEFSFSCCFKSLADPLEFLNFLFWVKMDLLFTGKKKK